MGNLLKHIQHPHNFDLRSVPQLVISQTNISQYPASMLCLMLLVVLGTNDYPSGISPLGWSSLQRYLASGLFDIMVIWQWWGRGPAAPVWLASAPSKKHYTMPEDDIYQFSPHRLLFGSSNPLSHANFTHLIKSHLKCQCFHWFPLARFTSLGWSYSYVGQDVWPFRLFNTLQCLWKPVWSYGALQCPCQLCGGILYVLIKIKGTVLDKYVFP